LPVKRLAVAVNARINFREIIQAYLPFFAEGKGMPVA
jgi:hypothetical protein